MEHAQESPGDKNREMDDLDHLVSLIPGLYYAATRVLEECAEGPVNKKGLMILWLIAESHTTDQFGPYLRLEQLVEQIADWFVFSTQNARSEVSKTKSMLMSGGYIFVGGGNKNLHLTEKGQAQVKKMRANFRLAVESALILLPPAEQRHLKDFVFRLVVPKKPAGLEAGEAGRIVRKGPMSERPRETLRSQES
jgi:hypothetical protein